MPLAYYSRTADSDFWTEHWGTHSLEELLAVARRSPLTRLIEAQVPSQDYSPPILRLLGHMILAVAVKPRAS